MSYSVELHLSCLFHGAVYAVRYTASETLGNADADDGLQGLVCLVQVDPANDLSRDSMICDVIDYPRCPSRDTLLQDNEELVSNIISVSATGNVGPVCQNKLLPVFVNLNCCRPVGLSARA